jgi:hypothetical protein
MTRRRNRRNRRNHRMSAFPQVIGTASPRDLDAAENRRIAAQIPRAARYTSGRSPPRRVSGQSSPRHRTRPR